MSIDARIENLAHEMAIEMNEITFDTGSAYGHLKYVRQSQYIPYSRKKYIAMEEVKRTRTMYKLGADGSWIFMKSDEEQGGIEFYIDGQTGLVYKPQGPAPAKTHRYDITNPESFRQMIANKKSNEHGWLYQDCVDVVVA